MLPAEKFRNIHGLIPVRHIGHLQVKRVNKT